MYISALRLQMNNNTSFYKVFKMCLNQQKYKFSVELVAYVIKQHKAQGDKCNPQLLLL